MNESLKEQIERFRKELVKISQELNITIGRLIVPAMTMGNKEIKESHQKLIECGGMIDNLFDELDLIEMKATKIKVNRRGK